MAASASQSTAQELERRWTSFGDGDAEAAELTRILLEAGADPNAKDNTGETPLHGLDEEMRGWISIEPETRNR